MSGRGRGRGRGYTPPTGAKLFLMRSAEECGLDSRNLRSLQDIIRPSLFPEIVLHSSGDQKRLLEEARKGDQEKEDGNERKPIAGVKRTATTVFLISKGREIQHRMQNSVFHVRPTKDVPDVIRHSDSTRPPPLIDASAVLSNCLGGRTRTASGRFIPEELVSGQRQGVFGFGGASSEYADATTDNLDLENKTKKSGEEEDDDEVENVENEDDEEQEEEEDYQKNYYASEDDESDGGDGEPTF